MTAGPCRLFPDLAAAGLYGGFAAAFALGLAEPLYNHALRLATAFSWDTVTGLLALPAQVFVAALASVLMVLGGLITALPALLAGGTVARALQARADTRPYVWLGAGLLLGLANALLLIIFTAIGDDGPADIIRACALYGGGGAGAGFFLLRRQRERVFYNS